jgi:PAS domain S-box-containing protein
MRNPSTSVSEAQMTAGLEEVVLASALAERVPREPDFRSETEAFQAIAQQMADQPENLLDTLGEHALKLCRAASSGVSLLETTDSGERIFRWVTLAGAVAPFRGGSTPANWSPCGTCLARGTATLFRHPERHFTYFQQLGFPLVEGLVVPLRSAGKDIGTIWVATHTPGQAFDAEDVRLLEGLGAFTSAALALHRARCQAEEAARLRTERAALAEWSMDGMIGFGLDGAIHAWNPGAARIYGHSSEEAVGRHITSLVPPPALDDWNDLIAAMQRGEQVTGKTTHALRRDGQSIEVEVSARPVPDEAGRPASVVAAIRDVTERRASETAAQYLAAIVESSEDAIISKDLNGIIRSWNRGAERIFGYTAAEIVGKPITTLAVPERVEEIPNILAQIRSGVRVDHYQTQRRTKDGKVLDISLTVSPIRDSTGKIIGASKIARDITAQKRAEEELRAANHELEQFAFVASHDLKEPLRMVNSYTQLLLRRLPPDGQLAEYGGYVRTGVQRMEALLDDLLAFSRVIHGERRERPVDLNQLLDETLSLLSDVIRDTGAVITRDALPEVVGDSVQLGQVLQNLLANSLKYGEPGVPPAIHVSAARHGREWVISVADNGLGFRPQYADHIFGLFKRLHRHDIPGTGIGLAICRRIVERHGGKIWAESAGENQGATFRFTVPASANWPSS